MNASEEIEALCLLSKERIFSLVASHQNYSWGKKGDDSLVGRLLLENPESGVPYAELWLGTHPKAPAQIRYGSSGAQLIRLDNFIRLFPDLVLGKQVVAKFGSALPFLFKILSIGGPLSIQAHPNKDLAHRLHLVSPEHYPDSNHKPELAVALTQLEMLYGLKSPREVVALFSEQAPRLAELLSGSVECSDNFVRQAFHDLLTADEEVRGNIIHELAQNRDLQRGDNSTEVKLVRDLLQEFPPTDPGIALSLLMNHCRFEPGEAVFISPHVPHAYLRGDILEVMATSDNVVRVGLTPKYRDEQTFVESILPSLQPGLPSRVEIEGKSNFLRFLSGVDEFEVHRLTDSVLGEESVGPILVFCVDGHATVSSGMTAKSIRSGDAVLVAGETSPYAIELTAGSVVFRVIVPL